MPTFASPDWLARNALRAFPLNVGQPVSDRGWALPDDLLVDAQLVTDLPCPAGVAVLAAHVGARLTCVVLGDAATGVAFGTAVGVAGATPDFQTVALRPASGLAGICAGRVTFGPALGVARFAEVAAAAGLGTHRFDPAGAAGVLANRCVLRTGRFPVRSLNGLAGRVRLRLGAGFTAVSSAVALPDGDTETLLTLSLADPAAFLSVCAPADPAACARGPVRTINGVGPDPATGDLRLEFVGFTKVSQVAASLRVLQLQLGGDYCALPALPDGAGRLPPDYDQDHDPVSPY